jgi:hypothetical protein
LEELQKASRLSGSAAFTEDIGRAYAASGYRGVLKTQIQQELEKRSRGQYESAAEIAWDYLALGRKADDHDSCAVFITASADFDTLRNDVRFEGLSRRAGFIPVHSQN